MNRCPKCGRGFSGDVCPFSLYDTVTVKLPVGELGQFLDRGDQTDYILGLLHAALWEYHHPGEPAPPRNS